MRTSAQNHIPPEVFAVWMKWVLERMSRIAEKSLDEDRWAAVKARAAL